MAPETKLPDLDMLRADCTGTLLGVSDFLRMAPHNPKLLESAIKLLHEAADRYRAGRSELEIAGRAAARQTTTPDYDRADRGGE